MMRERSPRHTILFFFNALFLTMMFGSCVDTPDASPASDGWSAGRIPADRSICKIRFVDPEHGFALLFSGELARTTNGGIWWELAYAGYAASMDFISPEEGLLISGDRFVRTEDGSRSWHEILPGVDWLTAVHFLDTQDVIATGTLNGRLVILTSRDGGKSWLKQMSKEPGNIGVTEIDAAGERIWMGGENTSMLASEDRGETWYTVDSMGWVVSLSFCDTANGYCSVSGGLYRTTTGGRKWMPVANAPSEIYWSVELLHPGLAYVAKHGRGPRSVDRIVDEGQTWTTEFQDSERIIYSLSFVNDSVGYAAGSDAAFYAYRQGTWRRIQ